MPTTAPTTEPSGRTRRCLAAVALAVATTLAGGPLGAVEDDDTVHERASSGPTTASPGAEPRALPAPGLPGLPRTSFDLAEVAVDSSEFRRASDAYAAADLDHRQARDLRHGIDADRTALDQRATELRTGRRSASARATAAERRLEVIEAAIADLAVGSYVERAGADRATAALADPSPSVHAAERRAVLAGASLETLVAERAHLVAVRDDATAEAGDAGGELDQVAAQAAQLAGDRPAAVAGEVTRGEQLARQRGAYETARVLARVEGVDFPLVALDAYHRAASTLAAEQPGCGLRWWALAGVSRVEGRHGTYGGSTLTATGQTTRRIIGIPLDGTNETQAIPDTDGGALDGDATWDRAVGPMQFIPGTWRRFAADGDGDGVADPHNLYDATLAAARYLCRSSGGLGSDDGLRRAYIAYNRSQAYVERVLGLARGYERTVAVPEPGHP